MTCTRKITEKLFPGGRLDRFQSHSSSRNLVTFISDGCVRQMSKVEVFLLYVSPTRAGRLRIAKATYIPVFNVTEYARVMTIADDRCFPTNSCLFFAIKISTYM